MSERYCKKKNEKPQNNTEIIIIPTSQSQQSFVGIGNLNFGFIYCLGFRILKLGFNNLWSSVALLVFDSAKSKRKEVRTKNKMEGLHKKGANKKGGVK